MNKKYKLRSYIYLITEEVKLLEEHFEVLNSRDNAEIVIVSSDKINSNFLDKKYYPELKIIISAERNIEIITLKDDSTTIVEKLIEIIKDK